MSMEKRAVNTTKIVILKELSILFLDGLRQCLKIARFLPKKLVTSRQLPPIKRLNMVWYLSIANLRAMAVKARFIWEDLGAIMPKRFLLIAIWTSILKQKVGTTGKSLMPKKPRSMPNTNPQVREQILTVE